MNLCIDIGNTQLKAGFFDQSSLEKTITMQENLNADLLAQWQKKFGFNQIMLSSVRNLNPDLIEELNSLYPVIVANHSMPLPIQIKYKTPESLGIDRILGALGAQFLYPDSNTLSIDAGTCITYDLVVGREFIGGAISPGLQMRLNAMHHFTDKLPLLEKQDQLVTFGDTTATSMLMGSMFSAIKEFDSFIDHFQEEFGNIKVILTGGDASFFERHAENAIFAAPNLVLVGMNAILLGWEY